MRGRYEALIASGEIERDAAQETLVARFSALEERLKEHRLARKSSALGWLFGARESQEPIKGLYIYGDVGRGKTMLMDLFFAASPVQRKRRAHFHEFMPDVHDRMHACVSSASAARSRATTRSSRSPPRSPTKPGCSASTNSTSPTSPTR